MSLALTHFAVGATLTALVTLYLLPPTSYARTLSLCGGIWGMIPDVHWVSPVYAAELKAFHSSVYMNLFWFHETLDVVDPTDSYLVAAIAVGVFVATTLVTDRWAYTIRERATPAMKTNSPIEPLRSLTRLTQIASGAAVGLGVAYLVVGVTRPGVGSLQPIYLGVGTALIAGGTLGALGHLTQAGWVTHHVPVILRRGCLTVGSGGTAVVGGTLLAAIARNGITAPAVAMAGLGGLLGLFSLLLAGLRVTDRDSGETASA